MSVWVVVGGQYGSEGKGKMTSYLSVTDDAAAVVRCGGPNAGHTVDFQGQREVLRQLPAGYINARSRLLIAPGAIVDPDLLRHEVALCDAESRLGVDPNAVILSEQDRHYEASSHLRKTIASTLSGTGSATSRKVLRQPNLILAGDPGSGMSQWLADVPAEVNHLHDAGKLVIVEGTQGFGLSLHHGDRYPFRTSRDTTASAFLSDVGISPRAVNEIVLVVRTFPIRVGGNSGPLNDQISWDDVQRLSGYPVPIRELTSVSRTVRRVGRFDMTIVRRAVLVNRPTHLAIHGLDYLNYDDYGKNTYRELSDLSRHFVSDLENATGVPATFLFTGPPNECLIDRRKSLLASLARNSDPCVKHA